ncbi:MAG: hypothetical protein K6F86_09310 [Lachnospiraceae bacterium]|nr:hypothetical protein [Lachnospiraceae bacterium]
MKKIEEMSCLEKLNSEGLSYILNGMLECVEKKSASEEEIEAIRRLESDGREIAGRRVSSYACAVLSFLSIIQYHGSDEDVLGLLAAWNNSGNISDKRAV